MKKIISVFIALILIMFSTSSYAGKLKDLVIDAEDAITFDFHDKGDLVVESVSGFEMFTTEIGIEVKASVLTKNNQNGEIHNWICFVSFEEVEGRFSPLEVNCN
ncbi:MAG: hypothetical protein EHM20_03600 [Alphaproteobacteria bacterium]|nr:MAG: hypothetical protein EHM20_03600 [Alphaproteobacteria bacterium]